MRTMAFVVSKYGSILTLRHSCTTQATLDAITENVKRFGSECDVSRNASRSFHRKSNIQFLIGWIIA